MIILALNCGSSSVKYQVYNWAARRPLAKGVVERVGIGGSFIKHQVNGKGDYQKSFDCPGHKQAIEMIRIVLLDQEYGVLKDLAEITAVGHRVVHGGEKFSKSVLIDPQVLEVFRQLSPLAPLHNPANIMGIEAALEVMPSVPHVAVMDTAFLQTMPDYVYMYAVPIEWYERYGVRRYGFHGTSHLYVSKRAAVLLGRNPFDVNLVTCHIGNGVSFTAVKKGLAFDHSMGLTPLEGLIMGTRSGDIDPAIIPFVCEKLKLNPRDVEGILNKKSGILGITAKYSDRRDVEKNALAGDARCKLAIEMECYRIKKYIGSYLAALGHVDAVVFTAGVGEKSVEIRHRSLENLEELGIVLDLERNRQATSSNHEFLISTDDSPVKVFVIPTDEELVFVEDVVAIVENRYDVHTNFNYSFQNADYRNQMREQAYQNELENKKKN